MVGRLKLSRMVFFAVLALVLCALLSGCQNKGDSNELTSTGQMQEQSGSASTAPAVPPPRPDDHKADKSNDTVNDNSILKITSQTCKQGFVLNLVQELNDGSKVADWNSIKRQYDKSLPDQLGQIGLGDKQAAWVTVEKREFWAGERHYFIQRFDNGKPSDFMAHDQVGNIYLGSWYDIDLPVLIIAPRVQ